MGANLLAKIGTEQTGEIKKLSAENAELKARMEALERLVKNVPYLTVSAESAK